MSATGGHTSGPGNPVSSTTPQPKTTNAYVWVVPPGMTPTQGGTHDGATRGEATGAPEVSDSQMSYLTSQLELERNRVRELTQQNLELSRQVHTLEYLQNAEERSSTRSMGNITNVYFWREEHGSHETTPEEDYYRGMARGGNSVRSQEDYGPYGSLGYQDYGY
ncbi:hypothetical protein FH972_005030 [Carpinus fangiana]|uniref:Uncharacterized protein n=1 Tax=Carpinus fangiana TaxID=176857 RepID=A0A5N6QMZ4_9ROSI|nr:hypothetical protein FH972_005030 [Carpinus fangiana]